jgi:two-component system, cell cycle sensor histidine kinase and response regulator CckA
MVASRWECGSGTVTMSDIGADAFDRSDRQGNALMVLLLAALLVGALGASYYLSEDGRAQFVLWFLAGLAALGVLGLFLLAIGSLQIAGRARRNDLTKLISDEQPEGLLVTDHDGRPVYANRAYMALSGTREGAVVRPVERLFTGGSDVSEAIYRLAQAARERRPASEELRLAPALDGTQAVGWYRIKARPVDRSGKRETLWTVTDMTRDREGQENVFQELQNAINYLDHAPAGFFSADPDGKVAYVNATLAGWLDRDIAEVAAKGLKLKDMISGTAAALVNPAAGSAGQVKTEIIDVDLRKRGGQSLPVRLLHRVSYGHDGTPGPSRTLVLNRSEGADTSPEAQRAAEVRFARFFHSAPLAIATVNREGAISQSNAAFARMFGTGTKADGGPVALPDLIDGKEQAALRQALASAFAGQADVAPLDLTLAAGDSRSARLFVTPSETQGADGTAIVYMLETTDQRLLQEKVVQSQKMNAVGQLAGGVAHDFNNVLTAIIGYSDLLLASHRPTDPSFQDIMQIKQNANRAASLVRQLLAFSRRQTLRPQVLQLNDAITDVQMMVKRLLGEKVDMGMTYGRDLWLVQADVNQFEQVVVNLAVNARDAMPDGGKLSLRTQNVAAKETFAFNYKGLPSADYVMLEVADTGTGMTPETMEKIFEPFFTTKEVGKGTGLGLSTVFGIVKQSGGFIFCDSEVGKGTAFRIFLPRHIPAPETLAAKAEEAKPQAQDLTGHGTILLVEDEEAVRAFGSRALRSRGYTVLEAVNGAEALEIINEDPARIDLVVSDVVMPEMDGPTLLTEVRKRNLAYPFVFASGYADDAFRKNLPPGSEFSFLPKPYSLKQLIETVKQAKT